MICKFKLILETTMKMKVNQIVLLNAKAQRSQRIAKKRKKIEIIIHKNEKILLLSHYYSSRIEERFISLL
ncbi:MAG: hypothetical protein SVR08_05355 [Spirochaetota bacterium]|nr:hypothetical protein [Spirochaetota bacterium]